MDCEKYEPLLLDELYEELDEVTSAAVKRHVSGCSRCASILNGMRSTRRAVALPMVELPPGLEDRIMAAAKDAQKVVHLPVKNRFSNVVSIAGRWAMRPQTAMAAVFLLMIGSTTFVIRSKHLARSADGVSVTEQGAPEPVSASQLADNTGTSSLDSPAAATAHGAAQPVYATPPPAATMAPSTIVAANEESAGPMDRLTKGAGREGKNKAEDEQQALGALALKESADKDSDGVADTKKSAPKKPMARRGYAGDDNAPNDISNAGLPGGYAGAPGAPAAGGGQGYASQAAAPPPPSQKSAADPQDSFSSGMASYRSRSFDDARKQFDSAATGGDQNAALWAARSVKEGSGCSVALPRYDAIAKNNAGTYVGNQASLEAAQCQVALGQLDAARTKLTALLATSTHKDAAQKAMNDLNQVAQKKGGTTSTGGANAAPKSAPRAAPAPAKLDSAEKAAY
jgi:hypothetical protein